MKELLQGACALASACHLFEVAAQCGPLHEGSLHGGQPTVEWVATLVGSILLHEFFDRDDRELPGGSESPMQ